MTGKWDSEGKRASLVWVTPNAEAMIAYIARVSSDNQDNPEYRRLFKYLIKHKHWSPFEHAVACVEINTSRAVAAQILRHRSFVFQEFSQRYAPVLEEPEMPEMRLANKTSRQSSIEAELTPAQSAVVGRARNLMYHSYKTYREMIDLGIASECARAVLPMCASTRMYMTGSLRSWLHYLELRTHETTQKEHREVAQAIERILEECFPTVFEIWKEGR